MRDALAVIPSDLRRTLLSRPSELGFELLIKSNPEARVSAFKQGAVVAFSIIRTEVPIRPGPAHTRSCIWAS